jgi:hypothetical protein
MKICKTNIWVYAHWLGMQEAKCIGMLSVQGKKGKTTFSFEYDKKWIKSKEQFILDPDISWFQGRQFPGSKNNFGIFLDSMPDTWGRTLMKRKAAQIATEKKELPNKLNDIDFLLGVFDIAISNTDDHLRNHGFIIKDSCWRLSPAYDINPSTDKDGLALNIDLVNNELDFELAKSVTQYFKLNNVQSDKILNEVKLCVNNWRKIADKIGISHRDQELMSGAFQY